MTTTTRPRKGTGAAPPRPGRGAPAEPHPAGIVAAYERGYGAPALPCSTAHVHPLYTEIHRILVEALAEVETGEITMGLAEHLTRAGRMAAGLGPITLTKLATEERLKRLTR